MKPNNKKYNTRSFVKSIENYVKRAGIHNCECNPYDVIVII